VAGAVTEEIRASLGTPQLSVGDEAAGFKAAEPLVVLAVVAAVLMAVRWAAVQVRRAKDQMAALAGDHLPLPLVVEVKANNPRSQEAQVLPAALGITGLHGPRPHLPVRAATMRVAAVLAAPEARVAAALAVVATGPAAVHALGSNQVQQTPAAAVGDQAAAPEVADVQLAAAPASCCFDTAFDGGTRQWRITLKC